MDTSINQNICTENLDQQPSTTYSIQSLQPYLRNAGLFGLGEAYRHGKFDCASLEEIFCQLIQQPERLPTKWNIRVLSELAAQLLFNPQQGRGVFEVAHRHYDLGNDLFSAMLDSSMSYTCGYWKEALNLEQAQRHKLDIICKKLNLKAGMRILDVGCGWGNFAAYAAQHYGVHVVGLTISEEQAAFAKVRCADLPVTILTQSYQDYTGQFDRVVSIEMIEAVGKKNLPSFFTMVQNCLKPGGQFLLQVITTDTFNRSSEASVDQFVVWLRKHIFPNGYLPTMKELVAPTSDSLVIEAMENLCGDYEKTLAAWKNNFEQSWPLLANKYDEQFHRIWRFYLAGCKAFFKLRKVQVYQIVYSNMSHL